MSIFTLHKKRTSISQDIIHSDKKKTHFFKLIFQTQAFK